MLKSNMIALPKRYKPHLQHALQVSSDNVFDFMPNKQTVFYRESHDTFLIPRFFGLQKLGSAILSSDVTQGTLISEERVVFDGVLRDDVPQKNAVRSIIQRFVGDATDENARGGYVVLGCGCGKTVCALYVMTRLRRKTLVLVNNSILMQQWKDRAATFVPHAIIATSRDSVDVLHQADIIVAMVQTLSRRSLAGIKDAVGFLVVDECHHTPTTTLQDALLRLGSTPKYVLGLTATPARRDGCDRALEWILGPRIFEYTGAVSSLTTSYTRMDWKTSVVPMYVGQDATNVNMSRLNTDLAKESGRNEFLVRIVLHALAEKRKILLLTDRVFHIDILHAMLHAKLDQSEIQVGTCVSKNKKTALKNMHKWDVILSTYQMFKEGLDVPHLDTLVLANPVTNIKQCVGRIQRQCAGKQDPLVFDVVDANIPLLQRFFYKRRAYYRKNKIEYQTAQFSLH